MYRSVSRTFWLRRLAAYRFSLVRKTYRNWSRTQLIWIYYTNSYAKHPIHLSMQWRVRKPFPSFSRCFNFKFAGEEAGHGKCLRTNPWFRSPEHTTSPSAVNSSRFLSRLGLKGDVEKDTCVANASNAQNLQKWNLSVLEFASLKSLQSTCLKRCGTLWDTGRRFKVQGIFFKGTHNPFQSSLIRLIYVENLQDQIWPNCQNKRASEQASNRRVAQARNVMQWHQAMQPTRRS